MDPSKNYPNFSYNFPNQPQNINPQNPNMQAPENTQSGGMQPNFQPPYMMPPNFGMQYPYLPYGYHPASGSSYVPPHMNFPTTGSIDPTTPRFSSGSTEIPEFSTQISLGNVGGDTPDSFLPPTHQPKKEIKL
jgi:hypothetical protein